jgi:predicted transcriptional regulator
MGLITELSGKYHTTLYGACINDLLDDFDVFTQKLPPQSECHEESLIQLLLSGPKTHEEIKQFLSPIIVSRTLKRLAAADLVNLPANRSYIFFHKSKRSPTLEKLTDSEIKVYQTIPNEGIAADKLAKLVGLSPRRTYAHIRHLKGKTLVFARKIPLTYSLSDNGQKLANIIQKLLHKEDETWSFTEYLSQPTERTFLAAPLIT